MPKVTPVQYKDVSFYYIFRWQVVKNGAQLSETLNTDTFLNS